MSGSNVKLGGLAALVLAALAATLTLVWVSGSAALPATQQAGAQAAPSAPRAADPAAQPAEALAPATTAAPTLQRSFVSAGAGNDANACSRTAPCRNFAKAITTTLDNGEIVVLDSGGYGQVTIDRPVSIISPPGVYAGITAFSGPGVIVNVAAGGVVKLSGLTLNGLGGDYGVLVQKADQVYLDHLTVSGFSQGGIQVATASSSEVFIQDTLATRNNVGIRLLPIAGAVVTAEIDRVRVKRNAYGIYVDGNTKVSIRDTIAARQSVTGFGSFSGAEMNLEHCLTTHNSFGIAIGGGATARVSETMIVNNAQGLSGSPTSFGNNRVGGNTTNGAWGTTIPES